MEWLTAYVEAHRNAFTTQNIKGGFRGTGIHPFLPIKVLDRLEPIPLSLNLSRSSTPLSTTPFNDAVLTDSPRDMNAIHRANAALNELAQSGQPLPSPAKNYIPYLTRRNERLHTRNGMLECENEDIKGVLGCRKRVLSGKRHVIDGNHLLTCKKMLDGVNAAEAETRKRQQKKGGKVKTLRRKARKESNDESSEESDVLVEELVDMFDCIEVGM
jgi:hypothetical protein